jgi:hypothetical protein
MKPTPTLPPPVEDYSANPNPSVSLCEKFCKQDWTDGIGIDEAAKALGWNDDAFMISLIYWSRLKLYSGNARTDTIGWALDNWPDLGRDTK